jgi:anti-anti-sigma factor
MQNSLKIDTRERFDIVSLPSGKFDRECAGKVAAVVTECRQNARSLIIDLEACNGMDEEALSLLGPWHEDLYQDGCSFVLCGSPAIIKAQLQAAELDEQLNLAPTLAEAIDLVSMEDVERELLGGE